jgi:cyclin A
MTLMETEPYLNRLPSEVAAACVALARLSSGNEIWPSHMCSSTGYTLEQLVPCIKDLHTSWTLMPTSPQQAIREKYKADK